MTKTVSHQPPPPLQTAKTHTLSSIKEASPKQQLSAHALALLLLLMRFSS
jgi:hypothetical protein